MNGGADRNGAKLEVAVNAIVSTLVRNGYLDNISSSILISVENRDPSRSEKLQQELATAVDIVLQDRASDAAVLSQTVAKNTTLEKQAKAHQISTGKAAPIHRIQSLNSALTFETLAVLSVEELKDLIEANAPGMPICKETAARLAKEYAGVKTVTGFVWKYLPNWMTFRHITKWNSMFRTNLNIKWMPTPERFFREEKISSLPLSLPQKSQPKHPLPHSSFCTSFRF